MIKYFCDECETELSEKELNLNNGEQHLCSDCYKNLSKIKSFRNSHPNYANASARFNAKKLSKLLASISGAKGTAPIIYCSPQFCSEMTNAIVFGHIINTEQEMIEVKDRGYVGRFHGYDIIVSDNTNPAIAYLIPMSKEEREKIRNGEKAIVLSDYNFYGEYYIAKLD